MVRERQLHQALQFLVAQDGWVMRDIPKQNKSEVLSLRLIPKSSGAYWISGNTRLRCGRDILSVFRVDTDSGGTLTTVFWKIGPNWYRHDDLDTLGALELPKEEVFPFGWSFSIPLEEDIFHQT